MLVRAIGRGGMGAVYLAHHADLARTVALKIIRPDVRPGGNELARFRREAEACARVSHPGLIKVYDFGAVEGIPYIAMEYVPGQNLAEKIRDSGAMPVDDALSVVRQTLEALQACHESGLLHRDLKPANLILDVEGRVRVLDLGLVKAVDRTAITRTGEIVGTPRYIPPEQLLGQPVDERSDIYQVGLILYECLTGQPVFAATRPDELMRSILSLEPPPLRPRERSERSSGTDLQRPRPARERSERCPMPVAKAAPAARPASPGLPVGDSRERGIESFLERAIARQPPDRFPSCRDALSALAAIATSEPDSDGDPPAGEAGSPPPGARAGATPAPACASASAAPSVPPAGRRIAAVAASAAATAVAAIAILGAILSSSGRERSPVAGDGVAPPASAAHPGVVAVQRAGAGWEVRWRSARSGAGSGLVEVRDTGSATWTAHESRVQPGNEAGEHVVRFRRWPARGRSLVFRVRSGDGPPSAERPLEGDGAGAADPVELAIETAPMRLTARWYTAAATVGTLSLPSGRPTTRDAAPCQAHELALAGLEPGSRIEVVVDSMPGPGGLTARGRPVRESIRLPSVVKVVGELILAINRLAPRALIEYLETDSFLGLDAKATAALRERFVRDCRGRASRPEFRGALDRYEQVKARIVDPALLTAEQRVQLIRRIEDMRDLSMALAETLGQDPGLGCARLDGPGTVAEPRPPEGLARLLVLEFGDGGRARGRQPVPDGWRPVAVGPPALFHGLEQEWLGSGAKRPAGRFDYQYPRPVVDRGPALRLAWLGYRVAGGRRTEKLVVNIGEGAGSGRKRTGDAAFIRGAGRGAVAEGYIRIDPRRLADPRARLTISYDQKGSHLPADGIDLDRLVLLGAP
jgi:hypothetical protein